MAEIICRFCGRKKEVADGAAVFTCDYCDTEQKVKDLESDILRKSHAALREESWEQAKGYAEMLLASNESCAEAYLVRLMADLHCKNPEALADVRTRIYQRDDFCRAKDLVGGIALDFLAHIASANEEMCKHIVTHEEARSYAAAERRARERYEAEKRKKK